MRPVDELPLPESCPVLFHIGQVELMDIDAILQRAAEREIVDDLTALRHGHRRVTHDNA